MRVGRIRSIDYFSLNIGDGGDHRLYVSLVLWRRGVSLNFFENKSFTRALEDYFLSMGKYKSCADAPKIDPEV